MAKRRKGVRIPLIQTQIHEICLLREKLKAANGDGPKGAIFGQPHIDESGLKAAGEIRFVLLSPAEAAAIADILKNGVPDD